MSKILSDVFQKSPSVFLSLRALGRSPPVPQLELGPRGARSGSGASARPSLSPAPGMLPIFPAGICSRALASRSAVSDGGGRRRAEPEGRGRGSKAAADESADPLCGPKCSLKPNRMSVGAWKSRWGHKARGCLPVTDEAPTKINGALLGCVS